MMRRLGFTTTLTRPVAEPHPQSSLPHVTAELRLMWPHGASEEEVRGVLETLIADARADVEARFDPLLMMPGTTRRRPVSPVEVEPGDQALPIPAPSVRRKVMGVDHDRDMVQLLNPDGTYTPLLPLEAFTYSREETVE